MPIIEKKTAGTAESIQKLEFRDTYSVEIELCNENKSISSIVIKPISKGIKRSGQKIRSELLNEIGKFPATTHSLAKALNLSRATALRHLEYLKSKGMVESQTEHYAAGRYHTAVYWKLKSQKDRGD